MGCAKAAHESTLGCLSARLHRHRFLFLVLKEGAEPGVYTVFFL